MLASSPSAAPSAPLRDAADVETQDGRRMRQRCLFICRVLLTITYVLGLGLAGYILYALSVHSKDSVEFAFAIAGIFVGLAVPLALHDLNMHLMHYVSPLQNHYMRIIWMIPIYALQSWVALVFHDSAMYLEAMRACYESFALYSFYQLMLGAAGGRGRLAIRLEERAKELGVERAPCLPPCCCLRGWRLGSRFVHRNTVGIYQYVFINTIVAVLQIITEAAGVYMNGVWDFSKFYPYASILINCSQMVALYMLAYFYVQTHDWYSPVQPLYKFLVIKAVIFLSWWQGLGLYAAATLHLLPHHHGMSDVAVAASIQNFAICIEMALAGVAHHYIFSHKDFYSEDPKERTPRVLMLESMAEFDEAHPGWQEKRGKSGGAVGEAALDVETVRVFSAAKAARGGGEGGEGEGGGAAHALATPMSYSTALMGMMPLDVIKDTGTLMSGGFGLSNKWQKRAAEERSKVHEMAVRGAEAVGGAGVGGAAGAAGAAGTAGAAGAGAAGAGTPGAGLGSAPGASGAGSKRFGRFKPQGQAPAEGEQ